MSLTTFSSKIGRGLDSARVLLLLGVETSIEQQPVHADNAVHRRSDLVAHGRKEVGFGAVGAFRFVLQALQFTGGVRTLSHVTAQREHEDQRPCDRDNASAEYDASRLFRGRARLLLALRQQGPFRALHVADGRPDILHEGVTEIGLYQADREVGSSRLRIGDRLRQFRQLSDRSNPASGPVSADSPSPGSNVFNALVAASMSVRAEL